MPIEHLSMVFCGNQGGIYFLSIFLALIGLQSRHSFKKHHFWTTGRYHEADELAAGSTWRRKQNTALSQ
jgi:hypothetical protein